MRLWVRLAVAGTLILLPAMVLAQTSQTGTISGSVKDSSGAVLPGASVTALSEERGFTRTAITDANGRYLFPAVPLGSYTITVSLSGFETVKVEDNLVEIERTTNVSITLPLRGVTDQVEVTGEAPIVDMTNTAVTTRVRKEEYETIPVGRSYQTLLGRAPGVVGTGNVNSSGALTGNNLFLMDGIDTTDPTTGTFGTNLNYEAIQEVSVTTSGVSAEYGRAQGAIVNVITKSGTNRFEGSAKYIVVNDDWNAQNKTKSEVTGASLEREKFDKVNPIYTFTLGGPILKDRAWFFAAYENSKNTTAQRQTTGPIPEDYQQTTDSNFWNVRLTAQIARNHTVWVKYFESPTDGFVVDYFGGNSGERAALTAQNQSAENWAAQWSGVFGSNWTVEAMFGDYSSLITVTTFQEGRHSANAPHFSLADSKYYNGAAFDGFVERPRQQFNLAASYFTTIGSNGHSFKAGFDYQKVESGAEFKFPNAQLYIDSSFDQASGSFVPLIRRDYESGASISKGKIYAFYLRDKFEIGSRFFAEAGLRFEKQTGSSDVGVDTLDTSSISPRLSASFDLAGNGKSLLVGSYSRFYSAIIQSFSDAFANIPQRANYDNYVWDGSQYVLQNSVRVGASSFSPNTGLKPSYLDELTLGFQRQFGRNMGAGVRYIYRNWSRLIDDVRSFNPDGSIDRQVVNYDPADRKYWGLQFTFEKRFSDGWSAQASYTYSKTEGNHFGTTFTSLGDYVDAQCRTTADASVGNGGIISCAEVQDGPSNYGRPSYDRPHNLKLAAAYQKKLGPLYLTLGAISDFVSKTTYTKNRSVNVLTPGTTQNAGPTATYYYEPLGSDRIDGLDWQLDTSLELTWQIADRTQAGFKAEVFNLTDTQHKTNVNNTVWCDTTANATCATAVDRYGTATSRGSFNGPRNFRLSAIFRF